MYFDPLWVPDRKLLCIFPIVFGVAGYNFLNCETVDEKWASLAVIVWSLFMQLLAVLTVYYSKLSDAIFGQSHCPHCKLKIWGLREKLKINLRVYRTRLCFNCKNPVKISYKYWCFLYAVAIPLFFAALIILNSLTLATVLTLFFMTVCLFCTSWFNTVYA